MQHQAHQPTSGFKVLRASERGTLDAGWLRANYSFSFGQYYNPRRMGFGPLRVVNQDHIQPGGGFGTHGHENMEIITWVQSGELVHEDSMGNRGFLGPGELQVMSAGSGVRHSEFNGSKTDGVDLMQMWILPAHQDTKPSWEQRLSPTAERAGKLLQLVGTHAEAREGLLTIDQDARFFAGWLSQGDAVSFQVQAGRRAFVIVARGQVRCGEHTLDRGDALEVVGPADGLTLSFEGLDATAPTDLILWDLA